MQVSRAIPTLSKTPCALTIGNFDGVHRGHQALLAQLKRKARALNLPVTVLTFEPHPRDFFSPQTAPARLSSLRHKLELLQAQGVDHVVIARFNQKLASLSAQDFIDQALIKGLGVKHLMVGDDFSFGQARMGNFAMLEQAAARHSFTLENLPTVDLVGERISSSAVRQALSNGEIAHANNLLGTPFELAGRVQHGDQIGRTLGFPTANIQLKQSTLPLSGVFAVTVEGAGLKNAWGAASIGVRPSVTQTPTLRLEVYILDFNGDLYDQRLRLRFWKKIRGEEKFPSLDALKAAIANDCHKVKQFFASQTHHEGFKQPSSSFL